LGHVLARPDDEAQALAETLVHMMQPLLARVSLTPSLQACKGFLLI
jgi:hypothetical protein